VKTESQGSGMLKRICLLAIHMARRDISKRLDAVRTFLQLSRLDPSMYRNCKLVSSQMAAKCPGRMGALISRRRRDHTIGLSKAPNPDVHTLTGLKTEIPLHARGSAGLLQYITSFSFCSMSQIWWHAPQQYCVMARISVRKKTTTKILAEQTKSNASI
jgi:hypothetical protein